MKEIKSRYERRSVYQTMQYMNLSPIIFSHDGP